MSEDVLGDLQHIESPVPDWLLDSLSIQRSSNFVHCHGTPIHYFCWGNATNPTLIFLHGRMSHARCWAFIAPQLAAHFHCVSMDLSGMGDSGHREYYSYKTRAMEVLAVLNATCPDPGLIPPILVTHSYGAVVALNTIDLSPGRFAGLIACDPSINHPDTWAEQQPRTDGPTLQRPHRTHANLSKIVERFNFAPPQPCRHPELKEYIAVHSAKQAPGGWQWKVDPWVYSPKEEGHNDWWVQHTQKVIAAPCPTAMSYSHHLW